MEAPEQPGNRRESVETTEGSVGTSQESTVFQSTSRGADELTDLTVNLSLAGANAQDFFVEGRQITDVSLF